MKDFHHWRHTLFYIDWQYPSASSASALKPLSKWNYPQKHVRFKRERDYNYRINMGKPHEPCIENTDLIFRNCDPIRLIHIVQLIKL